MSPARPDAVAVAVLAAAPAPGATGGAAVQARSIARAVETACAADIGPVTLWAAPGQDHATLQMLAALYGVALARQPDGDRGARMLAAIAAARGPVLVIGTDCPALTAVHLRAAADALRAGVDVAVVPVEDGGYALIGMREPDPRLFADMPWSGDGVMAETRRRLTRCALSWREPARLSGVDVPEDLERRGRAGLASLIDP